MSKVVGLLGVKKESRRLEHKGWRDFGGKPMFQWNVEKGLHILDQMYVTSDYDFILQTAEELGAIPIKRTDKGLLGECPNITYYRHALEYMDNPDAIVAIQVNSPTVDPKIIYTIKNLMQRGYSEIMTCHPIERKEDYHQQNFKIYGSVWALTRERLINYVDPYKPNPEILIVDNSVDIETMEDFNNALQQLHA